MMCGGQQNICQRNGQRAVVMFYNLAVMAFCLIFFMHSLKSKICILFFSINCSILMCHCLKFWLMQTTMTLLCCFLYLQTFKLTHRFPYSRINQWVNVRGSCLLLNSMAHTTLLLSPFLIQTLPLFILLVDPSSAADKTKGVNAKGIYLLLNSMAHKTLSLSPFVIQTLPLFILLVDPSSAADKTVGECKKDLSTS